MGQPLARRLFRQVDDAGSGGRTVRAKRPIHALHMRCKVAYVSRHDAAVGAGSIWSAEAAT
jgi:hypothetical protein